MIVQSDMALPNGTRLSTDFPNVCYSKNSTEWWRTAELPNQTAALTGYEYDYNTSHDRARAIAPALHVLTPLIAYDVIRDHVISHFFAFDDDGMMAGSKGCVTHLHPALAGFKSTEGNGAARIRPDLCPLNRYGYDPRCREWYDSPRKNAYGRPLYVTAPYLFANDGGFIGQSAVSPLIDPNNGYFVGAALFDFSIDLILDSLSPENTPLKEGGFSLLITSTRVEEGEGDVVIGPGFDQKSTPSLPVAKVAIAADLDCASAGNSLCEANVRHFDEIVSKMKDCRTGAESFIRSTGTGGTQKMHISYAPVRAAFLDPVDASDFSRGASLRMDPTECVYSLALVETEEGMMERFGEVEDDLRGQAVVAFCSFAGVIALALVIAILVSYCVAKSIAEPMLALVSVIRSLRYMGVKKEPTSPSVDKNRGSKEIVRISATMETLFEVIQFANVAFYAGELGVAFRVLRDSLRVFKGMKNKKAISVASNNLGNVLLFIYLEMKRENATSKYDLTLEEVIAQGTAYFREAITLGEAAYEAFYDAEGMVFYVWWLCVFVSSGIHLIRCFLLLQAGLRTASTSCSTCQIDTSTVGCFFLL